MTRHPGKLEIIQFVRNSWWLSVSTIPMVYIAPSTPDCNCIVTRGGEYHEILPEPEGFPEGSGNFSSYTPTQVTMQLFSITSTSQYFYKIISIWCDINMMVANWGEMHPQKVVGSQPLPHTWPHEYDIFYILHFLLNQYDCGFVSWPNTP